MIFFQWDPIANSIVRQSYGQHDYEVCGISNFEVFKSFIFFQINGRNIEINTVQSDSKT